MKRSGKILLEGTIEEFKKHCKGADNREYLLINTKEIKKDGTYTVYQLDSNTERVVPISAKGKYGKLSFIPYDEQYLTFVATSDGTFVFTGASNNVDTNTIQYSVDNGKTWSEPNSNPTVNVITGDKILWKGNMSPITYSPFPSLPYMLRTEIGNYSTGTATFNVTGNPLSLIYGDNFLNNTPPAKAYCGLFKNSKVVDARNLVIGTTVSEGCCSSMFMGCNELIKTPLLPATTLALSCYSYMFGNCISLTTVPSLPATTLTESCYSSMFVGCTSLTTAPELPATELAKYCYNGMFEDCTSLTTVFPLIATNLSGCLQCYRFMFRGCTNLLTPPTICATTISTQCYWGMFMDCTSLTQAPELPATTLADQCYQSMFQGCISLTQSPVLSATTLAEHCYNSIFKDCTNLTYIKMLATDISANNCLYHWVDGVSENGTFVKSALMTSLPTGNSGIPSGWTVEDATE